jgi:hypothetical protein
LFSGVTDVTEPIEPAEPRGREATWRFLGACLQLIMSVLLVGVAGALLGFALFIPGLLVLAIAIPLGLRAGRVFGRQEFRGEIR